MKKVLSVMLLVAVAAGAHIGGYALDGWLWRCLQEDGAQFTVGAAVLITAIRTYVLFVVLLVTTRAPRRVMHACWRGGGIGVLSLTALYAVYSPAPFALASLASALVFFTAALWPRRWLAMRSPSREKLEIKRLRGVLHSIAASQPWDHMDAKKTPELTNWICDTCRKARVGCYPQNAAAERLARAD